jgi:hypothetical protein
MSDAANTEFATEELLSYAQGNATAFALATIAYLKEQGSSLLRRQAMYAYTREIGGEFSGRCVSKRIRAARSAPPI